MSKFQALLASIPLMALSVIGTAHAALPEQVATEVGNAKTDMLAAVGLVIGAMVAVWGLLKLASKLGWR